MNQSLACNILNIQPPFTITELKRQYRIHALMYHPDKNKSSEATTQFQEVNSAFEYLKMHVLEADDENSSTEERVPEDTSYKNLLRIFIEGLSTMDSKNSSILRLILEKIVHVCEKQSMSFIETMDCKRISIIYRILTKYRAVFHLSDEFFRQLERAKNGVSELQDDDEEPNLEVIELKPSLDDLWDQMLYKIIRDGETFVVPLWHHQLTYEHFSVVCTPTFPEVIDEENDKFWIDAENNIHQQKTYSVHYLLKKASLKECVDVSYGKRIFSFYPYKLNLLPCQTLKWKGDGIPKIQDVDIYNVDKKKDVFLHVKMV